MAVPLGEIRRGDIVEMDIEVRTDRIFEMITVGTTFHGQVTTTLTPDPTSEPGPVDADTTAPWREHLSEHRTAALTLLTGLTK